MEHVVSKDENPEVERRFISSLSNQITFHTANSYEDCIYKSILKNWDGNQQFYALSFSIDGHGIENQAISIDDHVQILAFTLKNFKEALPNSFELIPELRGLSMHIPFSTEIPSSIGFLSNLETLDIWAHIATRIPDTFQQLHKLKSLMILGSIILLPKWLSALPKLRFFQCRYKSLRSLSGLSSALLKYAFSRDLKAKQMVKPPNAYVMQQLREKGVFASYAIELTPKGDDLLAAAYRELFLDPIEFHREHNTSAYQAFGRSIENLLIKHGGDSDSIETWERDDLYERYFGPRHTASNLPDFRPEDLTTYPAFRALVDYYAAHPIDLMHRVMRGGTLEPWEEERLLWEADYEIFSILRAHLGNGHHWIEQMAPRFQHSTPAGLPLA